MKIIIIYTVSFSNVSVEKCVKLSKHKELVYDG